FINVDFPAPFSPTSAVIVAGCRCSEMLLSTGTPPKPFEMSWHSRRSGPFCDGDVSCSVLSVLQSAFGAAFSLSLLPSRRRSFPAPDSGCPCPGDVVIGTPLVVHPVDASTRGHSMRRHTSKRAHLRKPLLM